ncbi:MAG TPA: methylated-DNA--[protein]-cysteine S-methyltransferase [Segeticoccus sp.]|nr:methylated-DNA--[protein]-cysteine S-methyltransferase [Segeticoccus sp.]
MTGSVATHHAVVESPIGPLSLGVHDEAVTALYMRTRRHAPDDDGLGERVDPSDDAVLAEAARQLAEYFAGERQEFALPLAPAGTDFQQRVWRALTEIPYGTTESYGDLARRIGAGPSACRAVGLANGRNPISIVIPCHRVIGASGSLTGYGGGLERKQFLLELERRAAGLVLF